MSDNDGRIEAFYPTIQRVARRIASEHRYVDREDIQQHLVLFVLKKPSLPTPEDATFSVSRLLTGEARIFCFREKQAHYMTTDEFAYETSEVKEILQGVFDRDAWSAVVDGEDMEARVSMYSDVAWAVDRLKPEDKAIIATAYRDGVRYPSGTKEYRKLRDITVKITNMLNHYARYDEWEGPGRRPVMSNNAANALIGRVIHD